MRRHPRLSVALPVHATSFAHTRAVARAAEHAGFDGVWVPDHLVNATRPESGVLECWTVLAALAASTEHVSLGTLVVATPFRHPPLLAKQVATVESIAPGRIVLGLGAGGFTYDATCQQLGFAPLTPRARVTHLAETIQCIRRLLGEDPADFSGRFMHASAARLYPRPGSGVRIVVAARRPHMLRVAAELADGWNCPFPAEIEAGIAALEHYGRDRATIEVSAYVVTVPGDTDAAAQRALARAGRGAYAFGDVERDHICGGPARICERLAHFASRGVNQVVLDLRGMPHLEAIDLLAGDVLPHL